MKKKNVIITLLVIFIVGFGVNKLFFSNSSSVEENIQDVEDVPKNLLSMMLETEASSGEYEMTARSSWPTIEDGYIFNSTLSKCENGSKLRWDDKNNVVMMIGTSSDKCFAYFDVYSGPVTLSNWVISQYAQTQGNNNIYFHDSSLENGAGDNSYRYSGSSLTTNNYVCFGNDNEICPEENLYRIIGVFDNQAKLIKWDYATDALVGSDGDNYGGGYASSSYYNSINYKGNVILSDISVFIWNRTNQSLAKSETGYSNNWSYSDMNIINLNTNFVNNIGSKWASIISKSRWVVGGSLQNYIYNTNNKTAYNNEINSTFTNVERVYEDKVGLMYVSDYYYGASPSYWTIQGYDEDNSNDYRLAINDNWIFMGLHEFTITRVANTDTAIFFINADGTVRTCQFPIVYGNVFPIRPTFYLNSDVKINGNHSGTKSDPVRLIVNKTF